MEFELLDRFSRNLVLTLCLWKTHLRRAFKLYMEHPRWCSKYNVYKYSQSQPTHL